MSKTLREEIQKLSNIGLGQEINRITERRKVYQCGEYNLGILDAYKAVKQLIDDILSEFPEG